MTKSIVVFKPCSNAPLERTCDINICDNKAIVDAKIIGESFWGYLCKDHFVVFGSKEPGLVNNLTANDITYTADDMKVS
jgi:hypothetical protein